MAKTLEGGDRPAAGQVRTFLVADVRGYTRFTVEQGDETAARLTERFAAIARAAAAAHDGEVIELRGDEALAVFSSARQALRTAVMLQECLARETIDDPALPLKVGIGLDAGEAVPVESGYRGAALNLAARLCSLAGPGEVLASETVVNLARKLEGLAYAERGAVQLKGFVDAVRVVQVLAEGAAEQPEAASKMETAGERPLPIGGFLGALPSGPLVAREAELDNVLAVVDAVAGGSGRLVFLVGEPGIGKTRLAQEATLALRNREFLVASGRCYEPQEAVPFYPFLEALGMLYSAAPAAIRAEVGRRWPYLFRLLPNVEAPSAGDATEGKEEQERLFWAVTGFVQAVAEEAPVGILLDDLHWADGTSLALLQHLARHTRAYRVLLIGTYRDVEVGRQHPLERALRDLGREQLVERVLVRRLEEEGTAALIATSFGEDQVSTEFSELIYRQTEGNPFFTQEVLQALVERGDIYRENGRWERREVEKIEVPESIRSAIGERLSRLGDDAQELLHEASVLGPAFRFDELQAMMNRSEAEVEAGLEEAAGAGLVRETIADHYGFSHALTQQALYAELSGRRKRRLHLAAGEAIEQISTGQDLGTTRAAELAWHFLEADDEERALRYALLAGDQAEAVFAHAEAERHYRAAVQLAKEVGDTSAEAQGLEKLGALFTIIGRFDEALRVLDQTLPLHRATGDADAEARVLAHVGRAHWKKGTTQEGIARLEPMLERFTGEVPSRRRAALYAVLGHLYFGSGRYREQLEVSERASQLARALGDDHILAEGELRRGAALMMLGRWEDGMRVTEDVVPLMEEIGDLVDLSVAFVNLASAHSYRGELDLSRTYLERAAKLTRQTGDLAETAFVVAQLADTMFTQGEWEQAEAAVEEAIGITSSTETAWDSAYPLLTRGEILLAEGRWEEASGALEQCIAIAGRAGDLQAIRTAHRLLAERDLLEGQPDVARARLEPLLEEGVEDVIFALPTLATAYAAMGDLGRASELATEAVARARSQEFPLALTDALRAEALVLAHREDWQAALERLEEGLALTRALRDPYTEARMLYEYGVIHAQLGEPEAARRRLEEALAILRRLGARPYIERAEQKLAEVE